MQKEKELPYRIIKVATGWLVQARNSNKSWLFDQLGCFQTMDEATDYLFAWKAANETSY